jgi:acid phosphatase
MHDSLPPSLEPADEYPTDWPYCNAARRLHSIAMTDKSQSSAWSDLEWRRRIETFGDNDEPSIAKGPAGEVDGVW